MPPLVVITGATAVGKTPLSLELAAHLPGSAILSADSRQVYRGMDIGTAKVGPDERARVPHHGLDLVDPDDPFSAADFLTHARSVLPAMTREGAPALMVGGTGLYLRAVARGLPLDRTGHDPAVRARLEERLAREGPEALLAELDALAPGVAARIDRRNPRRVVRALERALVGGSAVPPAPEGYPGAVLWLGLAMEPTAHRQAVADRARRQFASGLLDEAEALRARFPESLRAFSAMGYREAFDVLRGRTDLETAIEADVRRTWAYARRQRTWSRSEGAIHWLAVEAGEGSRRRAVDGARELVAAFLDGLGR